MEFIWLTINALSFFAHNIMYTSFNLYIYSVVVVAVLLLLIALQSDNKLILNFIVLGVNFDYH